MFLNVAFRHYASVNPNVTTIYKYKKGSENASLGPKNQESKTIIENQERVTRKGREDLKNSKLLHPFPPKKG